MDCEIILSITTTKNPSFSEVIILPTWIIMVQKALSFSSVIIELVHKTAFCPASLAFPRSDVIQSGMGLRNAH